MGVEKRGFASMDPARLKELSGFGGRKAHAMGKAHRWTSAEAREAGLISVKRRRLRRTDEPAPQPKAE